MLVALLTPPGRGAIAVLHLCGEGAKALVRGLASRDFGDRPVLARLERDGELLDEVLVRTVEGFTAEETVEISCHGGHACVERVVGALEALGARRGGAEELLERGVRTGRLDRLRAEAWAVLPRAATGLAARTLLDQAEGALSRAAARLGTAAEAARLLETSPLGRALASPPRVVLAGAPNVGKSTLFNALLRCDRALVSPEAGTTRDPVRETIAVEEVPLELVDTAGVGEPAGLLERLSAERTARAAAGADLILFLFDATVGVREEERRLLERLGDRRIVRVWNKVDASSAAPVRGALPVSALKGEGLDGVRRHILEALGIRPSYGPGRPVVFTARQERWLRAAARGAIPIREAREGLLRGGGDRIEPPASGA